MGVIVAALDSEAVNSRRGSLASGAKNSKCSGAARGCLCEWFDANVDIYRKAMNTPQAL
jgi:hypothetical protein